MAGCLTQFHFETASAENVFWVGLLWHLLDMSRGGFSRPGVSKGYGNVWFREESNSRLAHTRERPPCSRGIVVIQ